MTTKRIRGLLLIYCTELFQFPLFIPEYQENSFHLGISSAAVRKQHEGQNDLYIPAVIQVPLTDIANIPKWHNFAVV